MQNMKKSYEICLLYQRKKRKKYIKRNFFFDLIIAITRNGDIFTWTWNIWGGRTRECIRTAKNGGFCEELLSENDFETVLANLYSCDYGANASEAVQKISTDQKDDQKCSSCVIVCWIAKLCQ